MAKSEMRSASGFNPRPYLATLFSLYFNDLPKFTESSVRLFSDDTILIMSGNSLYKLNNTAHNEAKIIDKWLTSNKLILNIFKTSFILFSPMKMSADKSSLTIRRERINRTPVAKHLELLIDKKLKFDVHVKRVCKNRHKFVIYFGIFDTTSVRKLF